MGISINYSKMKATCCVMKEIMCRIFPFCSLNRCFILMEPYSAVSLSGWICDKAVLYLYVAHCFVFLFLFLWLLDQSLYEARCNKYVRHMCPSASIQCTTTGIYYQCNAVCYAIGVMPFVCAFGSVLIHTHWHEGKIGNNKYTMIYDASCFVGLPRIRAGRSLITSVIVSASQVFEEECHFCLIAAVTWLNVFTDRLRGAEMWTAQMKLEELRVGCAVPRLTRAC